MVGGKDAEGGLGDVGTRGVTGQGDWAGEQPTQWEAGRGRGWEKNGVRRLQMAVLEEAARTLCARRAGWEQALAWVETVGQTDAFAFDVICTEMGIAPDRARRVLRAAIGGETRVLPRSGGRCTEQRQNRGRSLRVLLNGRSRQPLSAGGNQHRR
jgi:hypothetical protein